jgi:hypothetical protein
MVRVAMRGPDRASDLDRGDDRRDADVSGAKIAKRVHVRTINPLHSAVIHPGVQLSIQPREYPAAPQKPPGDR